MSNLLVPREGASEFRKRYKWFAAAALLAFMVLVGRLFQLQALQGSEYAAIAHENIVRRAPVPTIRGTIRDAYGHVIASSRPSSNVTVVPGRAMPSVVAGRRPSSVSDAPDTWAKLAEMLRMNPDERSHFEARLKSACESTSWQDSPEERRRSRCWRPMLVREDISRDIEALLREHAADLVGAEIVTTPVRYYPYKNLSSHVLGYVGEIDADTLAKLRPPGYDEMSAEQKQKLNPLDYDVGDAVGATGVERAWESYLRGQAGWEKRVIDAHGRYHSGPEAERLLDDPKRQDPIPGRDLRLTIDIELMQSIERSMRPYAAGAAVVVDVRTGRVLAAYSKPDFDPNDLSGSGGKARVRETYARLSSDPLRPLLDKTMSGAFQPGSTFKPFSALAALEGNTPGSLLLDPEQKERCDGFLMFGRRIFHCTHVHGKVNMHDAIAASCNVYFFKLAETVGMDRIAKMAADFGLGEKTGLGTNPEAAGRVPNRSWYALRYQGQFRIGFTLNEAIGQGDTLVTPLQLALAYGALANGGTLYSPEIVRAIETSDGEIAQEFSPRVRPHKVDVKPENLTRVVEALRAVVDDPRGTAYPVRDPALDIAGKTGTAQTGYIPKKGDDAKKIAYYSRDHAWFAAFAPSRAPEVAVVVFIEHGGSGPTVAAPLAIQIVREYERLAQARGPHVKPLPPPPPHYVLPKPPQPPPDTSAQAEDAGETPPDTDASDEGGSP
ncbi:MAG TPA: penicillin-binding protein 2 [Polyangiaceae bacterium]